MRWVSLIVLSLICEASFADTRLKILVQPKNSGALSLTQGEDSQIREYEFKTEQEMQDFVRNLNPRDVHWEQEQIYQADDLDLQSKAESAMQADPLMANQWSLFQGNEDPNKYSGVDIDAVRAWEVSKGDENVVIYVMDSGIDPRDPDLAARVTSYFDGVNPGQFPFDQNGHGTHVASISSANGDNNYGIRGVVPSKTQLAIGRFLDSSNQGSTSSAVKVLEWMEEDMKARLAANPGRKLRFIGSNSWGGGYSQLIEEKMKRLAAYGYLPITSAGNHGRNNDETSYFPCNFKIAGNTCVAASDQLDKRAAFSGFGPKTVDLFAPGTRILGVVPGALDGGQYKSRYELKDGTSQAVPHVAGVAALIWSANPDLSPTEVKNLLNQSVDRLPGADEEVASGGRLNAYRAVLMATGQDPAKADRAYSNALSSSNGGGGCSLQASSSSSFTSLYLVVFCLVALGWLRRRLV